MRCRECSADLPAGARFCLSCGARVETPSPEGPVDLLRETLDKAIGFQYRIERLLGRGGMGAVYLAHELALDRDVAIKVLPPEEANTSEVRERFKREARTAARLNHPNIVPLHTFGEVSGLMYFVMGYVNGESLADRLRREGCLDSEGARMFLVAVCDALDYAHRQGIVHRDIKPDNILIDSESGTPRLTDFGISKATREDTQLTTAGQLIGTPHYMSPEQAMGRPDVGPQSDLYSLGVVAFEMVSGQRPFQAETALDALTQRLTKDPTLLGAVAPRVASDLALAINRCLQRKPADRWPNARSLREALAPTEDVEEPQLVRILRTMVTVVLPLILLAFAYVALIGILNPDSQTVSRVTGMLRGATTGVLIVVTFVTFRLRVHGLVLKAIVMKVFQQPHWWRSWYPPALRRRGDVWNRLPSEFRQSRAYRGLFQLYIATLFLPLQVITTWSGRLPAVRLGGIAVTIAGLVLAFKLRRRAIRQIVATLRTTEDEASVILTTPSWRVSAWRRPPAISLLQRGAAGLSLESESNTAVTRLETMHEDERPTRVF